MFDLEQFISDSKAALHQEPSENSIREVVARAVSEPASVLKGLGEPKQGEIQTLYRARDLTILNVIWAPWMNLLPHNHQMWAVIGIYTGREDNIFWRRLPEAVPKWRPLARRHCPKRTWCRWGRTLFIPWPTLFPV
jgi:predicted metal-dependent enzyme (double-stranded beta helix superfamily)